MGTNGAPLVADLFYTDTKNSPWMKIKLMISRLLYILTALRGSHFCILIRLPGTSMTS